MLRFFRRVVALAMLLTLTFFFVDGLNLLPESVSKLAKIQLIPALLGHRWVTVGLLVAMTFVLGRFYCSAICPLGILQDVIAWFGHRIPKKRKYAFRPAKNLLRWGVVVLVTGFAAGGITFVLGLLDPYSIFGRIATNVFRPVWLFGENLVTVAAVNPAVRTLEAFFLALVMLAGIGVLAYRNGRTYCNTICPVGTVLGLFSRFSLFQIRMNPEKCIGCGLCAVRCKSSCIDPKAKRIDASRCVMCFDCLGSCRKDALSCSIFSGGKKSPETENAPEAKPSESVAGVDLSKRTFLVTLSTLAAASQTVVAQPVLEILNTGKNPFTRQTPIAPPGAVSIRHLVGHCTACHLCVSKCPTQVLKPAVMEYGVAGMFAPRMEYSRGFCNYDCTICGDVCPNGAILPLTVEAKNRVQVGRVVFVEDNCVVKVDKKNCGACAEHCPTQAVTMVPYEGVLTIPHTDTEICVGCGGCESICPVRPFKAIYVEGNAEHQRRKEFEDVKVEVEIDDFGF
ncbi:MAG: 4Fe-4S binding protein [Planctomycetia bacterium]|nr:4Fe-4S binding protein [Planctomycetia bacterium]